MPILPGKPVRPAEWDELQAQLPRSKRKTASDDRNSGNSTTTVADDTHLAGIELAAGDYVITVAGYFNLTTTNTQKFKTQWGFSGTWSPEVRACYGPGQAATSDRQNVAEMQLGAFGATQDCVYDCAVSAGWTSFKETAYVSVTVAGNWSLKWAQASSSANNTSLKIGTYVLIVPVIQI
ncbi:hypothetical protein GCM10010112_67970 [Actinoplanes lobatus]|uniref:Uncharacterized protein n=1 Tax=Actinoplanes lobatus TaxID=113568 RepID=A0A7W7HEK6_9ACTN|nr:hypothetical protein [Actinoplanes lobatus]MBB4749123.1 hypothetical protein [Actinoplanes lobatus]GGN86415.1 hypothetical protein GCM10010112_67970 [Actinoplanes lobatus]GIE42779.1 hypothetical protein Alo02nite_56770 [Actinoplanes lobatus]